MATDPLRYTVSGMPATLNHKGGSGTVEMRFDTEEGQPLWLTFPADQVDKFAVRAHHGSLIARSQPATATGYIPIHGEAVAGIEVEPAVGGSAVLLMLSLAPRKLIPYRLPLDQAEHLKTAAFGLQPLGLMPLIYLQFACRLLVSQRRIDPPWNTICDHVSFLEGATGWSRVANFSSGNL